PSHVNIVLPDGTPRFTGTWTSVAGYGETWHGQTVDEYVARWNANYAKGLLQTDLFPYFDGVQLRVLGTWRQVPSHGYASWINLSDAEFDATDAGYRAQGLKVTHEVSYRSGGQLFRSAIWERRGGEWLLTRDSSGADYQRRYDSLMAQGYVLHQLHAYDAD